jgi:hypothetical protein
MPLGNQHMATSDRHSASGIQFIFRLVPLLLFLVAFSVYAATAAPGILFGDPSEYQFIPAILGIAHPPGYAFYTLLAKLWQVLFPLGTITFRTNLLAAAAGAWAVTAVYLGVQETAASLGWPIGGLADRTIGEPVDGTHQSTGSLISRPVGIVASLWGPLCLAVSPDFWQHAIHANAHIVSAALSATHLWLLIRWWRTGHDHWLAAFTVTLGLAATHHPITLIGVPAYVIFILSVRPCIVIRWRTLLLLIGCLLLGLTPFLYYPLRSPAVPFGPTDMDTWEGFWRHATAQGLRVNLFHFGLPDQPDRAVVFWSLLRLQFPLSVIILIAVGLIWLGKRAPKPAVLTCLFLIIHLLFTLNTVQDVMAYLLIPFAALSSAASAGALALASFLVRLLRGAQVGTRPSPLTLRPSRRRIVHFSFLIVLLFPWPLWQATLNLSRGISLRGFTAAEEYVASVHARFTGRGEGAILLSDWEHLTPLWAHTYTHGESLDEEDVRRLVYVNPGNTWMESVWRHIEEGPIYLVGYRPAVRDAGFRLLPDEPFYRVVAPPVVDIAPSHPLSIWADGRVHVLGYDLPADVVQAGEPLALTLYQSAPEPVEGIWMPYARLGPIEARWTTDSRLLTTQWLPGEVIVERYELPIPFTLPPGEYPLRLGYADLSGGRAELGLSADGGMAGEDAVSSSLVELATITVLPNPSGPSIGVLEANLANLDNQVALLGARARSGWRVQGATWEEPLAVRAGGALHLTLTWRVLVSPRDSFTVFIHLIDGAGRPVAGHDYTPLGGSCPSYLWFPKWLPDQILVDPYRLAIPADISPGDYQLEVGMYGMTSLRRLPVVDLAGNLAGDRVILGPVRVE